MTALVRQQHQTHVSSLDEMRVFAEAAVKSRFYGFKSVEEMLPLMLIAQSHGLSFMSVVEEYNVIQGRPGLKSEAMLARFQKAGGHIQWTELSDTRCSAIFSHPQCAPVEIDWDTDRAKQAGLVGKDMYKKYPRNMLKARVISDGVRSAWPACLGGLYTPEEVMDFEPVRTQVSPPAVRGQLTAHEEPGQVEAPREQSSSLKHTFTGDTESDGLPKGKSAHAARKNGDWQRVSERLDEELKDCATKAEDVVGEGPHHGRGVSGAPARLAQNLSRRALHAGFRRAG